MNTINTQTLADLFTSPSPQPGLVSRRPNRTGITSIEATQVEALTYLQGITSWKLTLQYGCRSNRKQKEKQSTPLGLVRTNRTWPSTVLWR